MMIVVNNNWIRPIATWFPSKILGIGQFHIICPIDRYIKGIKKHNDVISRFFKTGVSLSFNKSASAELLCVCTPFFFAPYPASSTALMITDESAVPSTPIEFVNRLTEQDVTPSTLETAFSTRALQAAQLMPVT